jgi:hypothetical protein
VSTGALSLHFDPQVSLAAILFLLFSQIFTLRVKIWENKSLRTLLPQAKWAINRG